MSVVVVGAPIVTIGATVGSAVYKGVSGQENAAAKQEARTGIWDLYREKKSLLQDQSATARGRVLADYREAGQAYGIAGEQYGLAGQTAKLGARMAQSQFTSGMESVGMGANMELRSSQAFGEQAQTRGGFATSGAIRQQLLGQKSDVLGKYKSDVTKLTEGRKFELEKTAISKSAADITYKAAGQEYAAAGTEQRLSMEEIKNQYNQGKMTLEEAREAELTAVEAEPGTFLEGMFS